MKKLTLFILFINFFVFGQKSCYQYTTIANTDQLEKTGKFQLIIKNIGNESFKIPKQINMCNMRIVDLEIFNDHNQSFEKMERTEKDIDCFTYQDKLKKIKPNKMHVYDVNLKSDFNVVVSENFFETFSNRKYRFKISFAFNHYQGCGENLMTDWITKTDNILSN